MVGLRGVNEVLAALGQTYSGPIKQVKGSGGKTYDYIPWNETVKTLDQVFGPLGWSSRVTSIEAHPVQGIYMATCEITASVVEEDGTVVTITRGGVGRSVARASRDEFERTGNPVSSDLSIHDTAASAAGSDAFSKAAKLLGNAFGLALYEKDGPTAPRAAAPAPAGRATAPAAAAPARTAAPARNDSEGVGFATGKQVFYLRKAGYTDQQIEAMSKAEVRASMDAIFAAPAGGKGDDLPF